MELLSPVRILDIFRRYVVGRMIALRETAQLAEQLTNTVKQTYYFLEPVSTSFKCK